MLSAVLQPYVEATDHRDVMEGLAREHGWRRGVELGLGHGWLFGRLVALGIDMVGVDLGTHPSRRAHVQSIGGGKVHWMSTSDAAPLVPDGWADFVFIDAAHSYRAVQNDIRLWQPKVRAGGWFGGHDYNTKYAGVMRAVDEAFGAAVVVLPAYIWARA